MDCHEVHAHDDAFRSDHPGRPHAAQPHHHAPLTRCRADEGRVPNALMAEYYVQRASAGLILSEATSVTPMGVGYPDTPGIWSTDQVRGWTNVTKALHGAGGRIFLQLWHVGRISHPMYLHGEAPVAPSAIQPKGHVNLVRPLTGFDTPRALETEEIADIVDAYRTGAENAKAAGFDGVEVHAANGYLLDQFLQSSTNQRSDLYGGSLENRARLLLEVIEHIHQATHGELDISVRLGIDDCLGARGQRPELLEHVVPALEQAGVVALMGSISIRETFHYMLRADAQVQAAFIQGVRHLRQLTSLPVGFAGFTGSLAQAETLLGDQVCDLVGMSRALFADNQLVSKSLAGHADRVTACRFDGHCFRDKSNPQLDRVYCCVNEHYKRPASIRYD
ncbi:hypothetical protein G3435_04520 [Pseudomonas sp. MAFF212428]|uniref:NADH:flavin oxidoreductase/NADH oxidase N-terminal domain-containing protein n=1 Tax=Pseudomonas brassicae TaxID=2708063 RepID=A0A6M0CSG1_9PSED|nr:hypothetical protein [Pseudomonas brassicae]